jgi:LPS-assembly protein
MVGISEKEGFYYEQALYIAEQNWWDLELKPQIRTNRGSGIYSTFRFVDSNVSKGSLTGGYFKEKLSYFLEEGLANQEHYGFNFLYDNRDVINDWLGTDLKGQSGLYMDITDMNDVDYINLSTNDVTKNATAWQIISRANLFYNTDDNYYGAYFKYYKDLRYESNEETLQNLPSLQYHRYLDTLLEDHLLYSFDVKSNNYYRDIGKSAVQTDINIPITLQTSLFDDYMTVAYKANLYAQHTTFKGEEKIPSPTDEYEDGLFARNYHTVSASSQLTRAFEDVTHVLDFGAQYVFSGSEMEDGYYDKQQDYCSQALHQSEPICEFYNINEIERNLQLYFSQYLFDVSGKQIIYHRLAQNISYEGLNSGAGELENELDYQITESLNFYNNMFYNYDENAFSKHFNEISFSNDIFTVGLSHMYQTKFLTTVPDIRYMRSKIDYRYDKHYSYGFKYDYDLERGEKKGFEIGFLYQKRCWDFGLRYVENNRPVLYQVGEADSIYDRIIYITIRLKPIMSQKNKDSGFAYRLPGDN